MYETFVASGIEKKQMWRRLRIDAAYLPSRLLQQFLAQPTAAELRTEAWSAYADLCHVLFNVKEFIYIE